MIELCELMTLNLYYLATKPGAVSTGIIAEARLKPSQIHIQRNVNSPCLCFPHFI
jgi:hypothetical protein